MRIVGGPVEIISSDPIDLQSIRLGERFSFGLCYHLWESLRQVACQNHSARWGGCPFDDECQARSASLYFTGASNWMNWIHLVMHGNKLNTFDVNASNNASSTTHETLQTRASVITGQRWRHVQWNPIFTFSPERTELWLSSASESIELDLNQSKEDDEGYAPPAGIRISTQISLSSLPFHYYCSVGRSWIINSALSYWQWKSCEWRHSIVSADLSIVDFYIEHGWTDWSVAESRW